MSTVELTPILTAALCEKLKVLGDENRMNVFALLRQGERCVCDIVDALSIPQSLVSHHLAVMRAAGLLSDRRAGRWVYYSIDRDGVAELCALLCEAFDPAGISADPAPDCAPDTCCGR